DDNKHVIDYVPYIGDRELNGIAYKAAPGISQSGESVQRHYQTRDASRDFTSAEPTPGTYEFKDYSMGKQFLYITEIMYDAPGSDSGSEYIEITNLGEQELDISGYLIGDEVERGGTEGMLAFPEGSYIEAGESIILANS